MNSPTRAQGTSLLPLTDRGDIPLVDLLDRLLDKGVAATGDVVLSVAGIDLVWLSLRAVLKGIDGYEPGRHGSTSRRVRALRSADAPNALTPLPAESTEPGAHPPRSGARAGGSGDVRAPRLGIDQEDVDKGLVQLVLTIVELLRELMERQALRRAEGPDLTDAEVEQLGLALLRLEERMRDLKAHFGLADEDVRPRLRAVAEVG